jgi:hypothetical protein
MPIGKCQESWTIRRADPNDDRMRTPPDPHPVTVDNKLRTTLE